MDWEFLRQFYTKVLALWDKKNKREYAIIFWKGNFFKKQGHPIIFWALREAAIWAIFGLFHIGHYFSGCLFHFAVEVSSLFLSENRFSSKTTLFHAVPCPHQQKDLKHASMERSICSIKVVFLEHFSSGQSDASTIFNEARSTIIENISPSRDPKMADKQVRQNFWGGQLLHSRL